MKHDVRSCGCNSTELPFQLRRENSGFQIILLADYLFYKNCQAEVFQSLNQLYSLCETTSSTLEVPSLLSIVKTAATFSVQQFLQANLKLDCRLTLVLCKFSTFTPGFYLTTT